VGEAKVLTLSWLRPSNHAAGPSKTEGSKLDLSAFFKEHGDEVKAWGMLSKYEESHEYLKQRMYVTLATSPLQRHSFFLLLEECANTIQQCYCFVA
jgi:hypothetical protein